jgi:hypothetical protein
LPENFGGASTRAPNGITSEKKLAKNIAFKRFSKKRFLNKFKKTKI